MTTGALLKTFRERAGISQEKLAALLHRTQSCISKFEKNQKVLDIQTFVNWTKVTGNAEAGIAFLYGVDPASIIDSVQTVLQAVGVA
ncbi:helix-turn-helix domain-containing protein [Paenibacillus gansuensis]|uniref:Helix-turn-helix domain-containing protein n=1 Tax=Paenibacillus gansuensis TaxID=306542 RepID=A0ABW5PI27_9BACL